MNEFSVLYQQYAAAVFRFALFLTSDRARAEDITSETFLRTWTSGTEVRAATVKGYLMTIARNVFLQQLREDRRRADLPPDVADTAPDAGRTAETRAELEQVLRDLQKLPEIDRAALLMRADQGLAYDEIAAALGVSLSAIKVKIHRARLRLAEMRRARRLP